LLGDNKKTAPFDIANRVLLGYFKDTKKYFPLALNCLKNKSGFIHYHDILPKKEMPNYPHNTLTEIAKNQNTEIKTFEYKKVKSYAPGINHYVFDIEVGEK
jgi:tRNA wybutosine-synthesizing protein 2